MEFMTELFLDEELESLSEMFSGVEESGRHVPYSAGLSYETSSNFFSIDETNMTILPPFDESLFYNLSTNVGNDCNSNHFSQEDSPSSGIDGSFLPIQSYDQNCYIPIETNRNQFLKSMDSYMMDNPNNNALSEPVFTNDAMHEFLCIENVGNEQASIDETSLKRKIEVEEAHSISKSPTKRKSRIPENHVKKSKENITSRKKKQKMIENDTNHKEEGKRGTICPSSSGYISEDDSNASQELNIGGASLESKESKIKTRASRGAATDPQSLYARRRRERINERLRILQNIVPNGTKVDISTMLEEAVHYVKFLQLQIKLLSSDELWMFAPIAYNGMDIGLYRRLGPNSLNI